MQEPGREYSPSSGSEHYRYSFNGKEQDPETYGQGNIYDYGFRIYNPRLGRFLSIDPLFRSYPWYTPYQFASNYPIVGVDIEGLENSILINNNEINKQVQANKYGRTPEERTNPSLFFSNRKKESIEALKQFGKGALLAGAIALDIFVTKGWATKAVVGYEVISAFQHNAASTLEGRLGQEKEMKEHLANAFLIWGTGKMFGIGFSATGELAELASQRLNFAKKFYNEAGFSNKQFIKESGGIDLNEKVFETTLKKGTLLEQWAIKNPITGEIKMGNYYTFPGQDPTKLGVSLENRVKISITLSEDTKFLQSTTGNIPDWNGSGEVFKGGATQLFQTNVKYTLNEMPDSKLIRNYLKGN